MELKAEFQQHSTVKRAQNVAAKAAARRLAQVMAAQGKNDDVELLHNDDVDDDDYKYGAASSVLSSVGNGRSGLARIKVNTKPARSPSPALGRNFVEPNPSVRSISAGRPSMSVRTGTMVPPSRPSMRAPVSVPRIEPPLNWGRDTRFTSDFDRMEFKDTKDQHEASALRDELDMLQEENDIILDKFRRAEERREEAEARARELEKQVAALGEGVSMEAKFLSKKEELLRQREAALKAAEQSRDGKDEEIFVLRSEIQHLKEETAAAMEQARDMELESKSLSTMTERMVLSHEEMEEVVLKRCWLSRYWGLAVKHGICADIAVSKYEHWSSLAPLPLEVVISAGQKAKDESWNMGSRLINHISDERNIGRNLGDITGEGNIENMLSVEMALTELATLKVEDAVALALPECRSPNLARLPIADSKVPGDQKFVEAFELSEAEAEDVIFKQAWLTYFWRRAKAHGVEEDIAEERLQFWTNQSGQSPTSHDAVDVERGILELRKLGIEQKLWEASRKELEQPPSSAMSDHRSSSESESL